jgi:2-methylcitrate dehydratase PrpD
MGATATAAIADWVTGNSVRALPPHAVALVRRAFLDTIAVTLLGARMAAPRAVAAVEFTRPGRGGRASVVAMGRKSDALGAALINGTSSHAELFDDNSAPMIAHPSGSLVCALLPLAQDRRATGREVVDAYAVGFEVGVKLGRMLNPGLYERGWHATRVLGVIGATAACARLIGLDAAHTTHALGIATSMAGGIRQNFGTMTMPLHVGLTARDAIHAALLAERDFGADPAALDGKYGFFRVFAEQTPALATFGAPFELVASGIIFKPYPSGAPSHAAVDAALTLRRRLEGELTRIARVTCFVHPWNAMTLRDEEPADPLQAKVSLRFCVAAALLHGRLSWREFNDETLADPALQALMRRVFVKIANDLPDNNEFPAELRIETTDGEVLTHRNDVSPGGSTRPLGDADVMAKMHDCAAGVLTPAAIDRVIGEVQTLETLRDVSSLCEALEGAPAADA